MDAPRSSPQAYESARREIDAIHARDPKRDARGRPAELSYADAVEAWVVRLVPEASPLLRLAARCQHLERWSVPRERFPEGRAGYHQWRQSLYGVQAALAGRVMAGAGIAAQERARATEWIAKKGLATNPGTQALEDAAILVFLEREIGAFIAQHQDYPRSKFLHIIARSWRKLGPGGREAALKLPLAPEIAALVQEALDSPPEPR